MGSASAVMRGLNLISSFVVARYLSREEVGVATLVWSVSVLVEAFNGFGMGQVVVRTPGLTHRQISGIHWFIVLVGLVIAAIMAASAPLVAGIYHEPLLVPMIAVGASKMVFVGLAQVRIQLLVRELRFPRQGAVETIATSFEVLAKIVLAVGGFGAWALVLSNALRGLVQFLAVAWVSRFRPAFSFAWKDIQSHLPYGARIAMATGLYELYRNTDFFLVGFFLGEAPLGVYRYAFDLGMSPMEFVLQIVNRVAFPIYARVQHDAVRLREAFMGSARTLFLMLAPIAVFMAVSAPFLVRVAYGPRWAPVVPLVPIFAGAAVLRGIAQLFGQLYNATGHSRFTLYDAVLTGGTLVTGFVLALTLAPVGRGTVAVAWVWLITYPLALIIEFAFVRRCAPIYPGDLGARLAGPAVGVLAMALGVGVLRVAYPSAYSPVLFLLAAGGLGLAIYGWYLRRGLGIRLTDLAPRRALAKS